MSPLTTPPRPLLLGRRLAWLGGLVLAGGGLVVGLGWVLLASSWLLPALARPVAAGRVAVAPPLPARSTPRPALVPPGEVASRYLARWSAGDYDGMYDLLAPAAQRRLGREAFSQRYRVIADEAMILSVRASLTPGVNSLAPVQPFAVTFDTARTGSFSEQNQLALSLVDGRWGIDWQPPLDCPATFSLPNRPEVWRDWQPEGQGRLTLHRDLVQSCNTIFYGLGHRLDARDPRLLPEMARRFGLGQATGLVELPEVAGLVPDPAWKQVTLNDAWATGDAINLSIGQGALLVTPLQLARAYAAIANGGTLWTPYLIETPRPPEHTTPPPRRLSLNPGTLTALRAALAEVPPRLVGPTSTAFAGYRGSAVAGKTGTAETGVGGVTQAWFVAYAPAQQADVAVVVLVERGGEGALVVAPVARSVLEDAYGLGSQARQREVGTSQSRVRRSH